MRYPYQCKSALLLVLCTVFFVAGLPYSSPEVHADGAPPPHPITWLAAGDSYSAGVGLDWDEGEFLCERAQNDHVIDPVHNIAVPRRLSKAWAPAALDILLGSNSGFEIKDFQFRACAGATRHDFFNPGSDNRPQQWPVVPPKFRTLD